jgi:hypothetical protein
MLPEVLHLSIKHIHLQSANELLTLLQLFPHLQELTIDSYLWMLRSHPEILVPRLDPIKHCRLLRRIIFAIDSDCFPHIDRKTLDMHQELYDCISALIGDRRNTLCPIDVFYSLNNEAVRPMSFEKASTPCLN